MRAARAARSTGVDGVLAFRRRGEPIAPEDVAAAMPRRKARFSKPLSPDRLASTARTSSRTPATTTTATVTKKPKRVPKGSAAKRSRALRTTLDGVSGGGRRGSVSNDVTSRFPMPYPGVERGRPPRALPATRRTPHHRAKFKSPPEEHVVRAGHHADREPLRMPIGSPGVARKHRKRPRSAVLAPSGIEFGRLAAPPPTVAGLLNVKKEKSGQFSSSRMKRANNNAELSGATSIPRGCRIVGGGRTRPKSAPSRRGGINEKGKKNAGGGGVLKVLSHVSDGLYKTPDELRIMKWVVLRETYLTKLHGVVSAGRKRAKTASTNGPASSDQNNAKRRPKLFGLLTELLSLLRRITVEIVEAVERWRGAGRSDIPFIWGSSNYLVKVAGDTAFLSRLPGLEQHLGVAIYENPFLCHVRLDGRPACLPPTTVNAVGKGRGKAVGHGPAHPTSVCFGASDSLRVSAERLEAAAAVLYREVIRASKGGGEGEGGERSRSRKPTRAGSSTMRWPARSGSANPPEAESDPRQSPQRPRSSSLPVGNAAPDPDLDPDPDPPPDEQIPAYYEDDSVGDGENRLVNEWRRQVSPEYGVRSDNQEDYGVNQDGHEYYAYEQNTYQYYGDQQDGQAYYGDHQDGQYYYGERQDGQEYYSGEIQDGQEYYYGEIQDGQDYGSRPEISGPTGHQGEDSDPHHPLGYRATAPSKATDDNTYQQQVDDPINCPEPANEPEPNSGVVDRTELVAGESPDDLGNGTGNAMGQLRGSPFLDVFNLCDGILSNLKGAGLVSRSTESIYEPCSLVADMGGMRDNPFLSTPRGTGDEDDGHVSADIPTESEAAHEEIGGEAPALRGSAYERQTCKLLAELPAPNTSKAGRSDRELTRTPWNRNTPEELTAKCFAAWCEKIEARQLHRDLKAARHHRRGQLRRAMSVWDKHRATILGGHLAEAFAGRFGLSTRFFVRYAFDALRANARGNRVAARNRVAMGRARAKLESVGRERLRQAWQKWLQTVEIRGSAHEDSFSSLVQNSGSLTEAATKATGRQGSKEDEWAQWLGDENILRFESPSGEVGGSPRVGENGTVFLAAATAAAAANPAGDGKTPDGQQLSPKLSFRGLGARILSMRSFRDKGNKTQVKRQQHLSTTPRLDPSAHKATSSVIDAFQAAQRGANTHTPFHGEGVDQEPPVDAAASRIQHAWRASREQRVAARITSSASLIQRSWRLRCRRRRAGSQVVRAWRRRKRIHSRTLNQALVEAASEGDLRAVAFLLRPAVGWGVGADANARGTNRSTALHLACRHAHSSSAGGTKEAETLARSARSGCDECALTTETALKRKLNPQGNRGDHGRRDRPDRVGVIRALVEAGAAVEAKDGDGFTPMTTAAGEGCGETVVALATAGAEVDAAEAGIGRRTPLVIAAQKSNASTTAALLEYGAKVDLTAADGLTPLHEAVGEGSIAVAEILVRAGAKVDAKNKSAGMTPLHLAVANDQHAAARLLVHSGANVCLPDARGLTPLRLTVEMADAPTVALLLAAEPPPDLSVEDQNGGTILHAACRLGLTDIARLLLGAGADPHARNAYGKTPELVALDLGHSDCAGLFYNLEIRNFSSQGNNPAAVAAAAGAASESASDESSDTPGQNTPYNSGFPRRGIPKTGDISDAQEGEGGAEGPWEDDRLDGSEPQREHYPQWQDDTGGDRTGAELSMDDDETPSDLLGGERGAEEEHRMTLGDSIAVSRARNKWLSLIDRESGRTYYQNERSGLTQWEAPEDDDDAGETEIGTEPVAWKSSSTVIRAGNKWLSLIDRTSGSTYYQNEYSGATQWDVPDDGGETGVGNNNHEEKYEEEAEEEEEGSAPNYEELLVPAGGQEGDWSSSNAQPQQQEGGVFEGGYDERPDGNGSGSQQETYSYSQRQDEEGGGGDEFAAGLQAEDDVETSRHDLPLGEEEEEEEEGEEEEAGAGRRHITWAADSFSTVLRARNKWLSLIDRESGSTYYQNERSGVTQWEAPEEDPDVGEAGAESHTHENEEEDDNEDEDDDDGGGEQEEGGAPNYEEQPLPPVGEEEGDWPSSNAYLSALDNNGGGDALLQAATDGEWSGGAGYYDQNEQPGLTQWEAPDNGEGGGGGGGESMTGTEPPFERESFSSAVVGERDNTWVCLADESGNVYYQNVQSGLTQWEAPEDGTVEDSPEAAYGDNFPIL